MKAELAAAQSSLATLKEAADASDDQSALLKGKNAKLTKQLGALKAKAAAAAAAAPAATEEALLLPAEVQATFDKANNADASGNKPKALKLYQSGVKAAMAHMKANPNPVAKRAITPILQQVMKRAQALKVRRGVNEWRVPDPFLDRD
jgi:hypothetical protein